MRIPRHLLHVELDDLAELGVPAPACIALRGLLADLPLLPDATHSTQLIGPPEVTLPSLAVLARHVGQGLRDHNLTLAHDRQRLHIERRKLLFLDGASLQAVLEGGDRGPAQEAVLFVTEPPPLLLALFQGRDAHHLASFVAGRSALDGLAHWRTVDVPASRHGETS